MGISYNERMSQIIERIREAEGVKDHSGWPDHYVDDVGFLLSQLEAANREKAERDATSVSVVVHPVDHDALRAEGYMAGLRHGASTRPRG